MTKLRKVQDEREARALLAKVKVAGGSSGFKFNVDPNL